jgi:exodeoxyribonuclease VII small subunit
MTDKKKTADEPTFEESLARLEAIVRSMESGELSLEKMMAGFEEGTGLVKLCTRRLNEVEKRIEKLVKKDGEVVTEPFDTDDDDAPAGDD